MGTTAPRSPTLRHVASSSTAVRQSNCRVAVLHRPTVLRRQRVAGRTFTREGLILIGCMGVSLLTLVLAVVAGGR